MIVAMPRDDAIIFSDLIGKLDMLARSLSQLRARWLLWLSPISGAVMPRSSIGSMKRSQRRKSIKLISVAYTRLQKRHGSFVSRQTEFK
jgi:hypothetical protein